MNRLVVTAIAVLIFVTAFAEDAPKPVARTSFVVSGLECGSCVYMVQYQLSHTDGIADAEVLQGIAGFARVSYDPRELSEHQVAQAVRETPGLHGRPYTASLRVRIPGYPGHAAEVKKLFAQWKQWVEVEEDEEQPGELRIYFLELKRDSKGLFPRGWSLADFTATLQKTLGLKCEVIEPAQF